jgi:predicted glycogen debranching enzyme
MQDLSTLKQHEWLEADGLGGFASGTVSGIRTRRYHAVLLTATKPPAGRLVLVNGFDASVVTANGVYGLSSQLYPPEVVHPDGARWITGFAREPWPKWIFTLEDGSKIEQEIFAVNAASMVALSWRALAATGKAILTVRPFFSGRDYHALHHENAAFRFEPEVKGAATNLATLSEHSENRRPVQRHLSSSTRLVPQLYLRAGAGTRA